MATTTTRYHKNSKHTLTVNMQATEAAEATDVVSVQIIYSEGNNKGPENVWKFCSSALLPFALGIPVTRVTLLLQKKFLNLHDSTIADQFCSFARYDGIKWLPTYYYEYFLEVYKRGIPIDDVAEFPNCDIRILLGYGFHNFDTGGNLFCGHRKIHFQEFIDSNASVLTVLDICNSPRAVAVLNGIYPRDNPKKFKRKKVFTHHIKIPIVCDTNDFTWAFRIGFEGQVEDDHDDTNFSQMSYPIGDAVVSCVLTALKSFVDGGYNGSLDDLFAKQYRTFKTGFLGAQIDRPCPHSDLSRLQALVEKKILNINEHAYDCELFKRKNLWFLTTERPLGLVEGDDSIAKSLVTFVVDTVRNWHEQNPDSLQERDDSKEAWKQLLTTFGRVQFKLKTLYLEFGHDEKSLALSDDGIPFETFAVSCGDMPQCLQSVRRWIATGDPESDTTNNE